MSSSVIRVDSDTLKNYADRLGNVKKKVSSINKKVDSLYVQVSLGDIMKVREIDSLTSSNNRINKCQDYLTKTSKEFAKLEKKLANTDPTSYHKNKWQYVEDAFYDVGNAVKKGIDKINKAIEGVFLSYYTQGWAYKVVQYGKCVLKAAKGIAKIVGAVGVLIGTVGGSTPVSILALISGCNDVYNAIMDVHAVYNEDYDQVGKVNGLKELLEKGGANLGFLIGDEELGVKIADIVYNGIDVVTALYSLQKTYDMLKKLKPASISGAYQQLKNIFKQNPKEVFSYYKELLNMDINSDDFKYQMKLAEYAYKAFGVSELGKIITDIDALRKVKNGAVKVGKTFDKTLKIICDGDWDNPVIEFFDKVGDIEDKTKSIITKSHDVVKKSYEGVTWIHDNLVAA